MPKETTPRQVEKFSEAARLTEANLNEGRWEYRLSQIAKQKPSQNGQKDRKADKSKD